MPPYKDANTPEEKRRVTEQLLKCHPLSTDDIREVVLKAWETVWSTTIGNGSSSFTLREVAPPATVVGYLLEKVMAKMLAAKYPKIWRGGLGSEKDLHCLTDGRFSVEVKTSGQLGLKIFGNRSYGQKLENDSKGKKDKSGYYITVNFYDQSINLIRFGWIDSDDWLAQKAASGQMSGLKSDVYETKLISIRGDYVLNAPLNLLDGLGPKSVAELNQLGLNTVRDILAAQQTSQHNQVFAKAKRAADDYRSRFT